MLRSSFRLGRRHGLPLAETSFLVHPCAWSELKAVAAPLQPSAVIFMPSAQRLQIRPVVVSATSLPSIETTYRAWACAHNWSDSVTEATGG